MEPPAACADGEGAADGEDAAAADVLDEEPDEPPDELLAGVVDPPHAASRVSMATAAATVPAAASGRLALLVLRRGLPRPDMVLGMP
jgi:hypothetical protein